MAILFMQQALGNLDRCRSHPDLHDETDRLNAEGRFLCAPGAVRVHYKGLPRILEGDLLSFLCSLEPQVAEVSGWAIVEAMKRPPLLSWKALLPLLTILPEAPDAHMSTGQILREDVLRRILGLAGILHHARFEERQCFPS